MIPASIETQVAHYIREQRRHFYALCRPLTPSRRSVLAPYFNPVDLDRVRTLESPDVEVPIPSFYSVLRLAGVPDLPDFSGLTAITFDDVVVSREPMKDRILFHEMVHVAQYRMLGIDRFAQSYVRGFLSGGSYASIPLERSAFELDARFWREESFRVDDELWSALELLGA